MADPLQTDSQRSRDGLLLAALAMLVAATVLVGALLPGAAPPPASHAPAVPAADSACLEWGDGCRICRRLPEGPACSLPGIACTPGEERCLRRSGG